MDGGHHQGGDDEFGEGGYHQGGDVDIGAGGDLLGGDGDQGGDDEELIHWMQGARQGKDAHDVIWIGKRDETGTFLWKGKQIRDIYLRYVNQGLQTVHVRATVDVSIKLIIHCFVNHLAKNLNMEDALLAFQAGQLEVTFKAGRVDEMHLISSFPDWAMFLLCRGSLAQEFKGHGGKVWQCSICNHSDNKRANIIRKKCTSKNGKHRCLFDEDQNDKLGDHGKTKAGKPLYLPKDSQTASPTQVSASFCLPLPLLPYIRLLTLLD